VGGSPGTVWDLDVLPHTHLAEPLPRSEPACRRENKLSGLGDGTGWHFGLFIQRGVNGWRGVISLVLCINTKYVFGACCVPGPVLCLENLASLSLPPTPAWEVLRGYFRDRKASGGEITDHGLSPRAVSVEQQGAVSLTSAQHCHCPHSTKLGHTGYESCPSSSTAPLSL
jgi:hypothetical protein